MAQMTPDTLFGPVFIVAGLSIKYFVDHTYIYKKILASTHMKKTHLWPKLWIWHCLIPFSSLWLFGGSCCCCDVVSTQKKHNI